VLINLDSTLKSLEVTLDGAVTTNQLPITAHYIDVLSSDQSISTISENDTVTNNTTAVTAVAAPASGHTRTVKSLSVYNKDTVSAVVTVQINNNGTLRIITHTTMAAGDTLVIDED